MAQASHPVPAAISATYFFPTVLPIFGIIGSLLIPNSKIGYDGLIRDVTGNLPLRNRLKNITPKANKPLLTSPSSPKRKSNPIRLHSILSHVCPIHQVIFIPSLPLLKQLTRSEERR